MPKRQKDSESTSLMTTDPRFSIIHTDPRFARPKKKDVKVPIDSRFRAAFKDKEFIDQPSVDRYGRKLPKDEGQRLVKKFYHLEEADQEDQNESLEDSEEEEDFDPARGIGTVSSSEEEESDEETEYETQEALVEEEVPKGSATSRLAAVNLDWDHIRAVDILAILQSFILPTSEEVVHKVSIYPSDFGKERIQKESIHGPSIDIKRTSNENITNEDGQVDTTSLRKYQLERLRYYYAIIECSSISIANTLYKALDGAELSATANLLDLRFVPDEVTFDDTPRDTANSVPDDHEPVEFVTDALQHSKPKLTWEEEDPERKRLISEAFKRDSEGGGKWEALLGNSEEEEEEDAEDVREKYRQLLLGGDSIIPDEDIEDQEGHKSSRKEPDSVTVGKHEEEETTLEKYKRKDQERRHRRREEKLARKQQSSSAADLGFDDPFFENTNSTTSQKRKEKEAKRAAKLAVQQSSAQKASELALLMHDETSAQHQDSNHFNINHILKAQKQASKHKKRKKRDEEKEIDLQEGFKMDIHDARFADVYTGGDFAIDPNSAAFRKGLTGMEALLQETRKRKRGDGDESKAQRKGKRRK